MKPNFRSVYYFGNFADANFLLRKRQHAQPKLRLDIAHHIVQNKFSNQLTLLRKTRKKDQLTSTAIAALEKAKSDCFKKNMLRELMALEGRCAKTYFAAYFSDFDWKGREPRVKRDAYNACLDIGYTFLFNFMENMCRLFGFDLYVGVYHQLWFKRKSLVCDLMEPFRCIVDHQFRKAFNYGTFKTSDFEVTNKAYRLKIGLHTKYTQEFYTAIINHKLDIFKYVQAYYRAFMGEKPIDSYPVFEY